MQDRQLYRAWEAFLNRGEAPPGVRDEVLASWRRSLDSKVPVDRPHTQTLSEGEFFRIRQQSGAFLSAAQPALQLGRQFLCGARSMVMLSNAHGTVLETVGDLQAIELGQDIGLCRGGLWDEGHIGTNAIGTALANQQPVTIHGFEHFCCEVQRWTCAAAPVFSPLSRRILGVVDLSGPASTFSPQGLAYVVSVARQIEGELRQRTEADHRRIIECFFDERRRWQNRDAIVVSRTGMVVYGSPVAKRQLERVAGNLFYEDSIPLLRDTPSEESLEKLTARLPTAEICPLFDGDEFLGVIIAPRPTRSESRARSSAALQELPAEGAGITLGELVGDSPAMQAAREQAARLAATQAPILIEGETGVGKELFARGIHAASAQAGPFVPVNCGALPRDLIGGEMFGYVGGAFTGASQEGRPGKLEAAHGGTLCLDEVSEMPLDLQPTLLRILEDGVVYRIGSHEPRHVDARLLAMTNRNLPDEIAAGRFRQDLYYRIAAMRLRIPPLREREDDIALLAEHFLHRQARRQDRPARRLDEEAVRALLRYPWPGNVRQLRNVITTTDALVDAPVISLHDLPEEILEPLTASSGAVQEATESDLASLQRQAIEQVLRQCGGNISQAARRLGIARSTLYCRIREQRIPVPGRERSSA